MTQLVGRLRRLRQGEGGFSSVEVLVAITILIVGATAFSTTTSNGLRLVGTSQERQTAVAIAGKWMEQARAYPYASVALDSSTVFGGAGTPDANVHGTTYSGPARDAQLVLADGT